MSTTTNKSEKSKLPPNLYWRGDKIWIKYQYQGKQHRESTGTVSVTRALEYLKKHKEQIDNIASGKQVDIKFDDVMLRFLKGAKLKLRSKTYKDYIYYVERLTQFFSGRLLKDIGRGKIKEYIDYRQSSGATDGVIIKELKCLSVMFNFSIEYELCDVNPVSLIKIRKSLDDYKERTRYLSLKEYKKLIEIAEEPLKSIIIFNVETGLRIGELLKLTYDDLNAENKNKPYIIVREENAKNKTARIVPLSKIALAQILAQPKSEFSNNIFNKNDGYQYLTKPRKSFANAVKKAGIKNLRIHDLRRTFGSWKLQGINGNRVDIMTVSRILGHKDIRTTQKHYAFLSLDNLFEAVN